MRIQLDLKICHAIQSKTKNKNKFKRDFLNIKAKSILKCFMQFSDLFHKTILKNL